jgi:hypothetical protein
MSDPAFIYDVFLGHSAKDVALPREKMHNQLENLTRLSPTRFSPRGNNE